MKTNHFLSLLAVFAVSFTFFACSGDSSGETAKLCGNEEYDANTYRCESGELIGKCKGADFYPAYQICNNGVIEDVNSVPSSSSVAPPPTTPSSSSIAPPPPPSSSSAAPPKPIQYCDYGPLVTQTNGEVTGGCFPMGTADDEANCALWGKVVSSCPSSSSSKPSSSSSSSATLTPNALVVTLTAYKELSTLDAGGYGDPRISFRVRSFLRGVASPLTDNTTKLLLNRDDIYEWSGTASDTVAIHTSADSVLVNPIVKEADVLSDDDYSPSGSYIIGPFTNGATYSVADKEDANHYIRITYGFKLIRK
ncbi:hypothetical protein R83H12_01831 [Fibrobacteria bacterium R8-3-H12]